MMTKIGILGHTTFTGKERDEETGYGYFGARYMDHELMTMWLSVDPLADKYPKKQKHCKRILQSRFHRKLGTRL